MSWWKFWQRKPKPVEKLTPIRTSRISAGPGPEHNSSTCPWCQEIEEKRERTHARSGSSYIPFEAPVLVPFETSYPTPPYSAYQQDEQNADRGWSPPTVSLPDLGKGAQAASDALDSTLNRASEAMDSPHGGWSGGGSGDYGSHSGGSGSGGGSFDSGSSSSDSGYSGSSSSSSDSGSSYSSSDSGSSSSSSCDSGGGGC